MSAPLTPEEKEEIAERAFEADTDEIARLRQQLQVAAEVCDSLAGSKRDVMANLDEAHRALDWYDVQYSKLAETACLLFDAFVFGIGTIQLAPNLAATEAGKAVKAALQEAWFAAQAGPNANPPLDDLREALEHPVIAGMLDAWAVKEG